MGIRNADVDAWLEHYEHPMREALAATREVMLAAEDRRAELEALVRAWCDARDAGVGDGAAPGPQAG